MNINKLNILLIGQGGREHALAKKILKSNHLNKLFAIPGNSLWKDVISNDQIPLNDNKKILSYINENNINLIIIGPEDVLKNGLVELLEKNNKLVFAPNKKAAMLELSKDFSKKIMQKYNIPTAKYKSFSKFKKAKKYIIENNQFPIVIKSNNLAQGKGVTICNDLNSAITYLEDLLVNNKFGKHNIAVIEEYLIGKEFSLMCLVNEEKIYPLPVVKDHKRIFDFDKGPNTGGMGVISDVNFLSETDIKQATKDCIETLTKALLKEKIKYLGILFAGIMKCEDGTFKVIEYNVRWGDPETQIILEKIDCDIISLILACINKEKFTYKLNNKKVSGIVVSAKGYPNKYPKNIDVSFLKDREDIFYMGLTNNNSKIINTSGRIFMIYAVSENNPSKMIYSELNKLKLNPELFHFRKDIDWK